MLTVHCQVWRFFDLKLPLLKNNPVALSCPDVWLKSEFPIDCILAIDYSY